MLASFGGVAHAEDASAPAILQVFEARWRTLDDRMADVFDAGYGRLWVPPIARAGSGFSVGYDVFDRFDLGSPGNETHYGTGEWFRRMVQTAHAAGVAVNPDLILNHNGVGNRNDANFVALGGYPGLALTLPGDIDGDFHDPFIDALTEDQILGQLAGLNDIAQEKNHVFIRHPVAAGNPANIPAGTTYNRPNAANAALYPDLGLGGQTVFDPRFGQNVTLYNFNEADPLAGDPVAENALGMLLRSVRWTIQEYDVDGFRLDAARHFPRWVLDYFDQAAYLAKRDPLLDGSPNHVYSFSETGFDSTGFIQDFIRRDVGTPGQVGGNRDVLDFRLFNRLKDNLSGNGLTNNWHGVRGASIDLNDDGLMNGSQGVSFVQSHDEEGAFLSNVAHAYTLMLPGNSLVYLNAEEYGDTGTFPKPGKDDALGGFYGETITRLVELRNSHGRGDFRERWIDEAFGDTNGDGQKSNIYIYERSKSALVGLNSRNDGVVETRSGVQTDFAPGTVLVELTGNAADPSVDPAGVIPDAVRVSASGQVNVSIPGNNPTGRGYVIYGVAGPRGTLDIPDATATLAGATQSSTTYGTARLADIDVVTTPTFKVRLDTTPVTLPAPAGEASPVRDTHADGDRAMLRIDEGLDLNQSGGVDHVTPGSVSYGFEEFTGVNTPGYVWQGGANVGTGVGAYEQTIDAAALGEGRHYVTVRAFRHRDAGTGGDGGPAVFTDFRRTVYVDLVPPESALVSFDPFASNPGNPNNRDLMVRSVDQTADNVHVLLDLGAARTDAEVLSLLNAGNRAGQSDQDLFQYGFTNVASGNHTATVVMYEPTGNYTIRRYVGLGTDTNIGLGLGDVNNDGFFSPLDMTSALNGFERFLKSNNTLFRASGDVTADGLIDNRDLFALEGVYVGAGVSAATLAAYEGVLLRRGDLDLNGVTNTADLGLVLQGIGGANPTLDINVDGAVDAGDARDFIELLVRTVPGDYNLDGRVDAGDYAVWRDALAGGSLIADGDFSGSVDDSDLAVWGAAFGFTRQPLTAGPGALAAPEPAAALLLVLLAPWLAASRATLRAQRRRGAGAPPLNNTF